MKKRVFLLVVLVLVLSAFLCACIPNQNETGNNNNKGENNGEQNIDGWESKTVDPQSMYIDFLSGFVNVAYELSANRVNANKQITGDAKVRFIVNDNEFWLTVKGKYDCSDPSLVRDKTIVAINLEKDGSSEADGKNVELISAYIYKDELYFAIGDNKVKFSMGSFDWTSYYPFPMKNYNSDDMKTIAGALVSIVKLNKMPDVKYRRNSSKEEYKYDLDVDVKTTIYNLVNNLSKFVSDKKLVNEIKNFISGVFGISVKELEEGNMPDCSMVVNYFISGKQIAGLKAELNIDMKNSNSYMFDEDKLKLEVDIDNVTITNDWANGVKIEFVTNSSELNSYKSYSNAIYDLSIPIAIYDENHNSVADDYKLNVVTKVFQDDNTKNFIFVEYVNNLTQKVDRALYVYDNKAYIYSTKNGKTEPEFLIRFDVDLSDIASRIFANDLNGDSKLDIYALVAYVLRNMTITDNEVKLAITNDFFNKVWYNFYDLINYVDSDSALRNDENVNAFLEYVVKNEVLFIIEYDNEDVLNIIENTDKRIDKILEVLSEADVIFDAVEESEKETENTDEPIQD